VNGNTSVFTYNEEVGVLLGLEATRVIFLPTRLCLGGDIRYYSLALAAARCAFMFIA
jgi:hypothetical protein